MVFSSYVFIFLFLPITLFLYYLATYEAKNYILLAASLFFYAYSVPKYLILMLVSIVINYVGAMLIDKYREQRKINNLVLGITIFLNIALLIYFKYANFLVANVNRAFGTGINIGNIILPVGISFYTFQGISYVLDIRRERGSVLKNPFDVALYISLFPQLIAGPIVRYETIATEIKVRTHSFDKIASGFQRFCLGFGKKILLANSFGLIADTNFALNSIRLTTADAWIGIIAYTFQIYFDFSGYSDMAIGLGRMLGFSFPENFNYPYISKSVTEFWRRWHISLSTWFRDYVYIPLGGNRKGWKRQIFNIMVVWLLTGIWHGAAWNYIAWGLYYGILLLIEKFILKDAIEKIPTVLRHVFTVFLIMIGWILFRSESLSYACMFIKTMFVPNPALSKISMNHLIQPLTEYRWEWLAAIILSTPVVKNLLERLQKSNRGYIVYTIICYGVFLLSIVSLVSSSYNPFIYFQF